MRLSVEVLSPSALGASELTLWRACRAGSPHLSSPYFAPEYALAADGVVPGAGVAVIHLGGAIQGFLPFQRRGRVIQPLAAPLTDYHGVIGDPNAEIDLVKVVRSLGAAAYTFHGLKTEKPPPGSGAFAHDCMAADVSGGLEAYLSARPQTRRFFKDKERRSRALEKEVGELQFSFEDQSEAFDFILAHKRAQYARSGLHDVFACGWTERFLRRLWEMRTPEFGGRFTTLRAGGRLVSAEYALRGGAVHHLWFPAYDPAFARFGPGTAMTIAAMRAAAEDPAVSTVDFGAADHREKNSYADPAGVAYEGSIRAPLRRAAVEGADFVVGVSNLPALRHARERLRRRFAVISACETTPTGWVNGAIYAFRHAARRSAAAQTA